MTGTASLRAQYQDTIIPLSHGDFVDVHCNSVNSCSQTYEMAKEGWVSSSTSNSKLNFTDNAVVSWCVRNKTCVSQQNQPRRLNGSKYCLFRETHRATHSFSEFESFMKDEENLVQSKRSSVRGGSGGRSKTSMSPPQNTFNYNRLFVFPGTFVSFCVS